MAFRQGVGTDSFNNFEFCWKIVGGVEIWKEAGVCQCRVGLHFHLWGYNPLAHYVNLGHYGSIWPKFGHFMENLYVALWMVYNRLTWCKKSLKKSTVKENYENLCCRQDKETSDKQAELITWDPRWLQVKFKRISLLMTLDHDTLPCLIVGGVDYKIWIFRGQFWIFEAK